MASSGCKFALPMNQDRVRRADMEPQLAAMRAEGGLARAAFPFGGEGWVATRYESVKTVLADPRFSLSRALQGDYPRMRFADAGPPYPPSFITLDPPAHTERRKVLMKHLTVKRVRALQPVADRIVTECLDHVEAIGPGADFVEEVARKVPLFLLLELLGIRREGSERFLPVALAVANGSHSNMDEAAADFVIVKDYFAEQVAQKRRNPSDDLLSAMVHDTEVNGLWTPEELDGIGSTLLIAGHDSTASAIGGMLYWLAYSPDLYARLRRNRDDTAKAVEEFLRFLPFLSGARTRIATEDVDVGGTTVRAGEAVYSVCHAANMDLDAFDRPEEIDFDRRGACPHLAFAYGPHACPGAQLARMDIETVLRLTVQRFPRLEPADPDPDWRDNLLLRGPKQLKAVW